MKSAKSTGDLAGIHSGDHNFLSNVGSNDKHRDDETSHHQIEEQLELGAFIGEKAGILANLMSGSNGRDKICALVQYTVQLYSVCMRHSTDRLWTGENSAVEVGERIVFNISQGRKIFKFMKFLEPIRKIHENRILKSNKAPLLRGFSLFTMASAFFLYLTDNMVWFANMGII